MVNNTPSMTNLVEKIIALRNLPKGWDYGKNGPVSSTAAKMAVNIALWFHTNGFVKFDVLPSNANGVVVVTSRGEDEVEVYCRATGVYDLVSFRGLADPVEYSARDFGSAVKKLEEMGWKSQRSFASCIHLSSPPSWTDSQANLLKTRVMEPGFPSSTWGVFVLERNVCANTFPSIMNRESAVPHLSSGEFKQKTYQMVAA